MKLLKRLMVGVLALPFYILFWVLYGAFWLACIPMAIILAPLFWVYELGKGILGDVEDL